MKKQTTHIALILDSSGSMQAVREVTRNNFNEQIQSIKKKAKKQDIKVTITTFADTPNSLVVDEDAKTLQLLKVDDYDPAGNTALWDAIGHTITKVKEGIKSKGKSNVLFIILTDGEENSSTEYSQKQIADSIQNLQREKGWTFSYVGANQDVHKVAKSLNIPLGNAMAYANTAKGQDAMMDLQGCSVSTYLSVSSLRVVGSSASLYSSENKVTDLTKGKI